MVYLGGDSFYCAANEEVVRIESLVDFEHDHPPGTIRVIEYEPEVDGTPHMMATQIVWVRRTDISRRQRLFMWFLRRVRPFFRRVVWWK